MFNNHTYKAGDVTNTLKINACSGGIYKTYKESWFQRFHLKSGLSEKLFRKEECYYDIRDNKFLIDITNYDRQNYVDKYLFEVVILQMIICGDMEVIAELILKNDFDKYCGIDLSGVKEESE